MLLAVAVAACDEERMIRIKGSDTEVNLAVLLAENFHKSHPAFVVSVSGGGSGLGIASLLNEQSDIANSSRELTGYEDSLFKSRNMVIRSFVFAEDAIAFIVHKESPLDSISVEALASILSGEETNWHFLSNVQSPITIYGRQSNSGTYEFIRQKLNIAFSREAREMNGNAQIIESIKRDRSGIGYVGAGYVSDPKIQEAIKVLSVSAHSRAISPLDKQAVANKQYYFQRPLYQFIRERSWEKAKHFIRYEQQPEGKAIIEASGYYAVSRNGDKP